MSIRFETKGSDNWRRRSGYQRTQRVPGPIIPMEAPIGFFRRLASLIGNRHD